MSIFMDAKTAAFIRVTYAQENKNPQRQSPMVSGQTRNDAVAEPFSAEAVPAAEKHEQADNVDGQTPGELQEIKEHPGPACNPGCHKGIRFFLVHMQRLFHRRHSSPACTRQVYRLDG